MEKVEVLQSYLAEDDDYDDDHAQDLSSSSSSSTSTLEIKITSSSRNIITATTAKNLNFLTGLCTGVVFSCLGFTFLLEHLQNMSPTEVMLFSIIWSKGVATGINILPVVMAAVWMCHWNYCDFMTPAAELAEKSHSEALAFKMRTSKSSPPKKVRKAPLKPAVPEVPVIIAVQVAE
jgi:hypothetical protein